MMIDIPNLKKREEGLAGGQNAVLAWLYGREKRLDPQSPNPSKPTTSNQPRDADLT
jgi:hypothetical protein